MKILHISASYKPAYIYGGPIMSVAKLCEAISILTFDSVKDGIVEDEITKTSASGAIDVEVFTTTANGKIELDVEVGKSIAVDGVYVSYFKRWTKDHSHFSPALLWSLSRKLKDDGRRSKAEPLIVHIHAWWNLVSVLSFLIAKWYKVPVVLSPRGMLTGYTQSSRNSFPKRFLHLLIGEKLLSYSHIHATSEPEKLEVLKIVSPKSITVIPNLVSVRQISESPKIEEQAEKSKENDTIFNLLFLSRIEQKKGLELLFDALSTISFNYQLTIAGNGEEKYVESLKAKAESLNLSKCINWIGLVSKEGKFSLMAEHDLLVLPSYNENFANVVIESLSVGTPVLVSENVGLADYVKSNDYGWVCNLNSSDIKEKIATAYQSKIKRDSIRQEAPKIILNDFNDEVLAQRYLELYLNVLRLPSGGQNT